MTGRTRQTTANPYYVEGAEPSSEEAFEACTEDVMELVGLDTENTEHVLLARWWLRQEDGFNNFARAFRIPYYMCMSGQKQAKEAVRLGKAMYAGCALLRPLKREEKARIRETWKAFEKNCALSLSGKRMIGKAELDLVSDALADIKDAFEIDSKRLYDTCVGQGNHVLRPYAQVLKCRLMWTLTFDPKTISSFYKLYLNTPADFEQHEKRWEWVQEERKSRGDTSLGSTSHRNKALGHWQIRAEAWVASAQEAFPEVAAERWSTLLVGADEAQRSDKERIKIHNFIRKMAREEGYPMANQVIKYLARSRDPSLSEGFRRALTQEEEQTVLWFLGTTSIKADALREAADTLFLPVNKLDNWCLNKDLGPLIQEVLKKSPNHPPHLGGAA